MKLEVLISAMNAEPKAQTEKMKIASDAVLINQCGLNKEEAFDISGGRIRVYSYDEKGVGVSRNHALEHASGDILLFSDEDIVYFEDYSGKILSEFEKHPEADGLFFNVKVCEERRTYYNSDFKRVHIWNGGRYPAYSIAVRRNALEGKDVRYSTLFGGGAKYSCGEDSLFIKDCLEAGLKLYRTPVEIGEEIPRPSTWFKGYSEKFFFDRGVLYAFLYGPLAAVWGFRFVFKNKNVMCADIPWKKAYVILKKGIKEGKKIK